MYDPTVGRFIEEDPTGISGGDTNFYRYCDNSPVNYTDPSGLKYGDTFATADAAAMDWGKTYNADSIKNNQEYSSIIFKTNDGKYSYTDPAKGKVDEVHASTPSDEDKKNYKGTVAIIHSHGAFHQDSDCDFSDFDYEQIDKYKKKYGTAPWSYLATPDGHLQRYDVSNKKTPLVVISKDLPFDPNWKRAQ
jgi:uncharacterized protein RhaS with RHS repeats